MDIDIYDGGDQMLMAHNTSATWRFDVLIDGRRYMMMADINAHFAARTHWLR